MPLQQLEQFKQLILRGKRHDRSSTSGPTRGISLSPIERAELIDGLLRSFDPNPDQRHLDAWRDEAESRIDAFDAEMLTDDSAEAVFDRINQR
jgi:putative addiction module component (TIGR02574 family)